jgi:hypothetical protein
MFKMWNVYGEYAKAFGWHLHKRRRTPLERIAGRLCEFCISLWEMRKFHDVQRQADGQNVHQGRQMFMAQMLAEKSAWKYV